MSHRRCGALLAGFTLAACLFVGGCQSTSSIGSLFARNRTSAGDTPVAGGPALMPGMEVEWHIKTAQNSSGGGESGRAYIAADGTIELGPYGSCRIGGMPAQQAMAVLEKHLASYLHSPVVQITTPMHVAVADELPWRKAGTPTLANMRGSATVNAGIRPVDFETPSTLGDKDKKDTEQIGPPRTIVPPVLAMPHDLAGPPPPLAGAALPVPPQPNECRPALLPPYVIGPTDVLRIENTLGLPTAPIGGPHLVGPDGAVRIGVYGSAVVAGQTLEQARVTIAEVIYSRVRQVKKGEFKDEELKFDPTKTTLEDMIKYTNVDVLAYNSKLFYIIADGGGLGEQVVSLPITGNDNVLNAMAKINGLPLVSSKYHIWVARLTCPGCPETRLPVDWVGITKRGEGTTNWQLMPGDRIYVQADVVRTFNNQLAKWLAPVNQVFGTALLSSQTVNSIKSGSLTGVR